eukprot:scaffold6918_cov380-Prasinococcus_capsulatus_cf.AAC.12
MAGLTEAAYEARGQTYLYIPDDVSPESESRGSDTTSGCGDDEPAGGKIGRPRASGKSGKAAVKTRVAANRDKGKELVRRLEATLARWTRQIKDAIANSGGSELGDDAGPLEEVHFWRRRAADLAGLEEQLAGEGVRCVERRLEACAPANGAGGQCAALRAAVHRAALAANRRVQLLSALELPCQTLAKTHPKVP